MYLLFIYFIPEAVNWRQWPVAANRVGGEAGTLMGAKNWEVRAAGVAGTLAGASLLGSLSDLVAFKSEVKELQ